MAESAENVWLAGVAAALTSADAALVVRDGRDLPASLESVLRERGVPIVRVAMPAVGARRQIEVRVLGGFEVRIDGRPVLVTRGVPSLAVKAVALTESVATDVLVEMLWPGAGPGVGMSRLRNVLSRVRACCGELLVRDGDVIRLADEVEVDAREFENRAGKALVSTREFAERAELTAALAHYSGELLPGDRYADWTAAPRERLERLRLTVMSALVDVLTRDGAWPEAIDLVHTAIEIDRFDESWYVRGAEILLSSGHAAAAAGLLRRAAVAMNDCGLGLSARGTAMWSLLDGRSLQLPPQRVVAEASRVG